MKIDLHGDTRVDAIPGTYLVTYGIHVPIGGKRIFTEEEKRYLKPIAETIAMLDGNAFFSMKPNGRELYEYYLPEAHALFESNGGMNGWGGEASWIKEIRHETPAVQEAYEQYMLIKRICHEEK